MPPPWRLSPSTGWLVRNSSGRWETWVWIPSDGGRSCTHVSAYLGELSNRQTLVQNGRQSHPPVPFLKDNGCGTNLCTELRISCMCQMCSEHTEGIGLSWWSWRPVLPCLLKLMEGKVVHICMQSWIEIHLYSWVLQLCFHHQSSFFSSITLMLKRKRRRSDSSEVWHG